MRTFTRSARSTAWPANRSSPALSSNVAANSVLFIFSTPKWKRAPRGALNATQLLGHKGPTGALYSDVIGDQCGRLPRGSSLAPAAICQQPRLLPRRYDPTWPALDRFLGRGPRNPVITGKRDQLLDVAIVVVPELDGIRKVVRPPHSHAAMGEQNANCVKGRRGLVVVAGLCYHPR